jgi:hypothetical protein
MLLAFPGYRRAQIRADSAALVDRVFVASSMPPAPPAPADVAAPAASSGLRSRRNALTVEGYSVVEREMSLHWSGGTMRIAIRTTLPAAVGMALATAIVPALAPAQTRVPAAPSTGRIAITLTTPTPPPLHGGMYPLPPIGHGGYTGRLGYHNVGGRWVLPYVVENNVGMPVPVPYPVAVPVPYAVPVRPEPPKPPPVPYDPTKAIMRIIGGGADGGGGVMRLTRVGSDSLQIVWLGTTRPVREARLFVADQAYQPLRSLVVTESRREARFRIGGTKDGAVAFAGVAIVHADGSRKTVLVPLSDVH